MFKVTVQQSIKRRTYVLYVRACAGEWMFKNTKKTKIQIRSVANERPPLPAIRPPWCYLLILSHMCNCTINVRGCHSAV